MLVPGSKGVLSALPHASWLALIPLSPVSMILPSAGLKLGMPLTTGYATPNSSHISSDV